MERHVLPVPNYGCDNTSGLIADDISVTYMTHVIYIVTRGGHYSNLFIDTCVLHYRLQCIYSGIYGPRSVSSEICPSLVMTPIILIISIDLLPNIP
jgi:hypothetical protein